MALLCADMVLVCFLLGGATRGVACQTFCALLEIAIYCVLLNTNIV